MAPRFCGICGTEVDETAVFCPSCGNPIEPDAQPAEIPPAPAWPEPEPASQVEAEAHPDYGAVPDHEAYPEPSATLESEPEPAPESAPEADPERTYQARPSARPGPAADPSPPPVAAAPAAGAAARGEHRRMGEQVELPFTWPTMLSGWLIGIGSLVAALSLLLDFRTFANPVTLIVFLLLLAVSASVFLASNIPDFANRRMWVLVVVVAAFGIGLWRVGLGANFAGVVFFLATLAAAGGAVMLELGRDRPMGGSVG
jgi:hypothetical protein